LVLPPDPPGEISVPVTVFLPAALYGWARETAAAAGQSLDDWIHGLIERARTTG
jgi:hypothetical protein